MHRIGCATPIALVVLTGLAATGCAGAAHGTGARDKDRAASGCTVPSTRAVPQFRGAGAGELLGPGRTGTRDEVPWSKVGSGWVLAETSGNTPPGSARPRYGPWTLYLVDPAGGRYLMYQWGAKAARTGPLLVDWSVNKSLALIVSQASNGKLLIRQLDLATGTLSAGFGLPSVDNVVGYDRASGLGVLAQAYTGPNATVGSGPSEIVHYDLHGHVLGVLARSRGSLSEAQPPGGALAAVSSASGIKLVRPSDGAVVCRLAVRGAAAHGGCHPLRWWTATTVLALCVSHGLWLVPTSGARPVQLSPPRNGHGVDPAGDIGAWALPSGLYLQAVGACGVIYIVKQLPSGVVRAVNIPGTVGNNNRVLGALGTRLLVRAETGCPGSDSLLWFDPANQAVQMLLRAPKDLSGVIGAIPYGWPGA